MSKRTPRAVPDQAARDRIARDLDVNLIVEAGAGSGKTQALTSRMAAGIAAGVYALDGMAAVTFTRKAAAELRGRFQLALEHELAAGGPADRQARVRHALSNLERFFAGTIHAFCARLLRERPVEAAVSPGFVELDEIEERLVRQQAWRDFRSQARAAGDPDLIELIDAGITARQLDQAFETVCLYEDVDFPTGDAPMPDLTRHWAAVEAFWAELSALMPHPVPPDHKCTLLEKAAQFERSWRAYLRGRRDAALLVSLLRFWESTPKSVPKWWPSTTAGKQARQLWEDFRAATVQPCLAAWRQHLYARCIGVLVRAREAAKAERRRRNTLSFNDLLLVTADVLRRDPSVRRALQRKYRWLFVDEFQDTDPLQAEIMFLLAADETSRGPAGTAPAAACDWRTVALRPGALFVVGDPKQSIYRFRRADIDIYNEVRSRIGGAEDEHVVRLTMNFRSVPDLCTWVNRVFEARFPARATPQAPAFGPLVPAPGRLSTDGPHVAAIEIPDVGNRQALMAWEADAIARYIRSEVAAGRRAYGDFLILTRRKKPLGVHAAALEAAGVPIEVSGAGAFAESEEVRELALLLAALADPQDAVSLTGVLRGSLFGLSDRDLFAFRQAGGWFGLFDALETDDPAARRVSAALAQLRRWYTWTRQLPAGTALERVLADSGYLALAAIPRGGVEAGDLLHAVGRVRAVVADGFTLAAAADALASWCALDDEAVEDSTEVDSLPLEPGRTDVVRLMNLHKAKGLEATVVFLADPTGGYEPPVNIRIIRQGAEAAGYFRIVEERENSWVERAIAEPTGWDRHEADERAYLDAELDRLLYVAATRAKEQLVIGRYTGKVRNPAWLALTDALDKAPALSIPAAADAAGGAPADVTAAAVAATDVTAADVMAAERAAAAIAERHRRAVHESWSAASVTAELKRVSPAVEDAAHPDDPTRVVLPRTSSHRADAGAAWGSLVHGLLEHAMRHSSSTRDDLGRLARWLTMEQPELRPLIERAIDTVVAVTSSGRLTEARAAGEAHEEVPFAVRAADLPGTHVTTGCIDLVHRDGDGWRIVDYKTDVDAGTLETRYAAQVRTYAEAWGRVSGGPTTQAIVSVRMPGEGPRQPRLPLS